MLYADSGFEVAASIPRPGNHDLDIAVSASRFQYRGLEPTALILQSTADSRLRPKYRGLGTAIQILQPRHRGLETAAYVDIAASVSRPQCRGLEPTVQYAENGVEAAA